MRFQVTLPKDLAERLQLIALKEHRYPRQQAELMLYRAIEQVGLEPEAPTEPEENTDAVIYC